MAQMDRISNFALSIGMVIGALDVGADNNGLVKYLTDREIKPEEVEALKSAAFTIAAAFYREPK